MIKRCIKKWLSDNNIVVARFDKKQLKEQTFSCHLRLDRTLIGQRLFGARLGVFGRRRNSFSFWLEKDAETGRLDLRYLLRDNGFFVEGSMQNGYGEEFLKENDIVKLQIFLYREDGEFGVDFFVSHPQRDDSRKVEYIKGYSSTGFHYHLKANPRHVIASMTDMGVVNGLEGIKYTEGE